LCVYVVLGLELRGLHPEPFHQPFFVKVFFWDRVSWTIYPSWLWTTILLISASWVARITSVSHQHLDNTSHLTYTPDEHKFLCISHTIIRKFNFLIEFRNRCFSKKM
jgi:hypothetical protein